jgi:hypothetical protein
MEVTLTDIVERLRDHKNYSPLHREAAAEITRLRAALQEIADNEDDEMASATTARRALEPKP